MTRRAQAPAALLAALLLAGCGGAPANSGSGGAGASASYQAPQGQGVSAQDQSGNAFSLGKLLVGTVKTTALHLPSETPAADIALAATALPADPNLDPALTAPAWTKAGGFCLPATDGNWTGYPDTITPDAGAYATCGYAVWSPQDLVLAFVVTDPHPNAFVSDTAWENAAVETYFGVAGANAQWMNDLGVTSGGAKVGPVTSIPGAQLTAAMTDKGYILVTAIPWSTLDVSPKAGVAIPFNIQTDAPAADGSSDFFYYGNGTKPSGADPGTFGTITLG